MADTTTHYNLIKPKVGGDNNAWGSSLNLNLDTIDLATLLASTPSVADNIARDTLIPAPRANQYVRRNDSGYFERYDQPSLTWRPEGVTRAAGPVISIKSQGNSANWHDAFVAALAAAAAIDGIIEIDPIVGGTYPINANLDLSGHRVRWTGKSSLQPANGVAITMPKTWDAGFYQILDDSLGGTFNFESTDQREFRPEWWGAKSDRATRSDQAIQKAHNAAYGAPGARHLVANVDKNKQITYAAGWYMFDDEVNATNIYGWHLNGPGRESCTLIQRVSGKRLFNCDTVAYFSIRGISFGYLNGAASAKELINFDTTGNFPGSTKTQQGTIEDCSFNGNLGGGVCDIGMQFAYSGGNAQGDTILIKNCGGFGFGFAYVAIGDRAAIQLPAYNALGIIFLGGDIQACMKYGVYCYGGQIFVDGTSCQNNQTMAQLDAAGYDFYFPIFAQGSVLKNVRSESCCLTNAQSSSDGIVIENCDVHCGNVLIGGWQSTTAYAQGALWMFSGAQANASGAFNPTRQSGRPYMAWAGGISGADGAEPDMVANDSPYYLPPIYLTNATTNNASVHVTFGAGNFQASHVGWKVAYINPATGVREYRTIAAVNNSADISLDVAPSFSAANVTFRAGKGIVDGTTTWMAYDFNVIQGSISYMLGGLYQCGRINPNGGVFPRMILFPRMSRTDWWGGSSPGVYNVGVGLGPHHGIIAAIVGQGNAQGTPIAHPNINTDINSRPVLSKTAMSLGDGMTFDAGDGGFQFVTVGVVRGDGVHFYDGTTQTQHTRNTTAVLETLGKVLVATNDTPGIDQYIAPGMGRGTGGGGKIHLMYQPPGASGSSVPDAADGAVIDNIGRWQTMLGTIKGAVSGTIVIGAGGSATPNPAGAEVYRYQINGAATINAPINPAEGETLTLEIFNNTAGALTPTLNAVFLGGSVAIGAGKWQTRRFIYDATLTKWKPTGAWSGDL